jgi:hypothetical protein
LIAKTTPSEVAGVPEYEPFVVHATPRLAGSKAIRFGGATT